MSRFGAGVTIWFVGAYFVLSGGPSAPVTHIDVVLGCILAFASWAGDAIVHRIERRRAARRT
ncbi:hypothetical protein ACVWZ4_007228 [Bradyrhizobium sp. USDA 4472]